MLYHLARSRKGLALLLLLTSFSTLSHSNNLQQAEQTNKQTEKQAQASQQRINQLDERAQNTLNQYRQLKSEVEQLELYNKQMQKIIENQQQELQSMDAQIQEIERTERGILPLMQRMISSLTQFIQADIPFLDNERQRRVAQLNALMQQADTTVSEKFRRVLEAYQIEVDYGRNIEAYRQEQAGKIYDFLRIGRVALFRVNQDKTQAWAWEKQEKTWHKLDNAYLKDLKKAYKVAKQISAPQMLILPMPTAGASS